MSEAAFVGVDWGTTNRRAWLLDPNGDVMATHRDNQGSMASRGRFADALLELLARWTAARDVPVVMGGMVGSTLGWQTVPYLDCDVPLTALPNHLAPVAERPAGASWWIVPGMSWRGARGRKDVMRGEETQLLGALALSDFEGWVVLPGTHSKWVQIRSGTVATLRTYMTGELFASLRERGTLAPLMSDGGGVDAEGAFEQGLRALGNEELSQALFGARARVMVGDASPAETAPYVSGLLMGAEWREAARLGALRGGVVRVVGDPALARWHACCARRYGCAAEVLDLESVQLAAWRALSRAFRNER